MATAEPSILYFLYQDLLLSFCGVQILRQGTALSPECLATCNRFSLWRTSDKLLAVDSCFFLSMQSVLGEQQASTQSRTGRREHSWSRYTLDPFLQLPFSENLVAMNSFIVRVSVSYSCNLENMVKHFLRARSSRSSILQGEFAEEELPMVSKLVLTF